MFKTTILLAGVAAAGLAGTARADGGVEFAPYGPGGLRWTVSVPAYQTPFNYGQRTTVSYDVPFAGSLRPGCFVVSPWLPVSHGDGEGEFIADFYSTWEGEIARTATPTANVFTLQVEVMGQSGAVTTQRRAVSSGVFHVEPIYFPTPNTTLYWGDLDNSLADISVLQSFAVHRDDQVRVSVCDLAAGSSMEVRHLVVRTIPNDN